MSEPGSPGWPLVLWRRIKVFFLLEGHQSRNTAMEGLRGYAVLLVFFVHSTGGYLRSWRHIEIDEPARPALIDHGPDVASLDWALMFLSESHHGVDLFFLLSGFLIARILNKNRQHFSYPSFLRHRLLRIYPAFFLSILVAAYVYISYLKLFAFKWSEFLMNLVFLWGCPDLNLGSFHFVLHMEPYNFVTWSLFYEMMFYLVFPVLFFTLGPRQFQSSTGQLGSVVLLFATFAVFTIWSPRFWGFFFGAGLGICSPEFLTRMARKLPTWLVLLAYVAVVGYFKVFSSQRWFFFQCYGLVASMVFVKTCYDDGLLNRIFRFPPLRLMGNVSYSFYLMHVIAIACMTKWFFGNSQGMSETLRMIGYFGIGFLTALLFSIILFGVAERWYFSLNLKK